MTHTPGPWTIEKYGNDETPSLVIHKDSESRVCFMATPGSRGDPARIEADARLITAAPDMLAELRKAIILADDAADAFRRAGMPDQSDAAGLLGTQFRAVVAKAETPVHR